MECPKCKSENLVNKKSAASNIQFHRWKCLDCGWEDEDEFNMAEDHERKGL